MNCVCVLRYGWFDGVEVTSVTHRITIKNIVDLLQCSVLYTTRVYSYIKPNQAKKNTTHTTTTTTAANK